ncbi:hypothetical protein [Rhizobium sullae]|uniref:hypothetical protein n=1 Tax=Rhizobium sullae TaxID=50338 RepID=UPI000B351042|nr:hypothetical protein [Rhizobium sullae]
MSVSLRRAGRIAILGTSLVQQNHIGDDTSRATSARGWMSWAEVSSNGRLSCPIHHDPDIVSGWEPSNRDGVSRFFSGRNFGGSGQKAIEIEPRLPRPFASDFDLIVVDADTSQEAITLAPFCADDGSFFPFQSTSWRGAIGTPPLKLEAGAKAPELHLDVILRADARPLEIKISRIDIRPVASPVRA